MESIVTNLHLPRSTPPFMISAFIGEVHADVNAGRRTLLAACRQAIAAGYRFYSFGDTTLIV